MATITTCYRLIALGYGSLPAAMSSIACGDVNKQVRHAWYSREDASGYVLNPIEACRVIHWWYTQPFAEEQLQAFMDSEGNIPEDYLTSGLIGPSGVDDEAEVALLREIEDDRLRVPLTELDGRDLDEAITAVVVDNRRRRNVRRQDCNGGLVVLNKEALEVKEHRRIHKKHYNQFAICILASVKMKFGVARQTAANRLAITRYVGELMKQRGVRAVDAARVTPFIVAAAFIPSDADLAAAAWLNTSLARSRLKGWTQYDA